MSETRVVDRIEGQLAVFACGERGEVVVPLSSLPEGTDEGTVLKVPLDGSGRLDWSGARIDADEAERRRARALERLRRLAEPDPGGHIDL